MLEWEQWSSDSWDDEEEDDQRRDKLKKIFAKYLSDSVLQREQSRYESLSFQEPPEFEGNIISGEAAGKGKVWIYVSTGTVGGQVRYLMGHEGIQWKIEGRDRDVGNSGKWAKEPHI